MLYRKSSQGHSSSWLWSASTDEVGLVSCDVFLVGEACTCVLVDGAGSYLSEDSAVSSSRFWSVYGFSMPLGSCSSFHGIRRVYFRSCFKVALSM